MEGQSLTESERRWYDLAAMHAGDFATRAAQHDRDNTFAVEAYEAMRESGYAIMPIPEEFGGGGASLREVAIAQNRLAQGDGPTTLAINMHLAGVMLSPRDASRWPFSRFTRQAPFRNLSALRFIPLNSILRVKPLKGPTNNQYRRNRCLLALSKQ